MKLEELKELKEEYKRRFKYLTIELENKIAELEKSEQPTEKAEQQTSRRWKPENEEGYYYLTSNGDIFWDNYSCDKSRYAIGNCFKTKEEAEFMVEKLKVLAEMREYADDEQEWDGDNKHWYIYYNYHFLKIQLLCMIRN